MNSNILKDRLLELKKPDFEVLALDIFRYQYHHNQVYRNYVDSRGVTVNRINTVEEIPCMPISAFKHHKVISGEEEVDERNIFKSSGTTGGSQSMHYISDLRFYHHVAERIFIEQYGSLNNYCILGLLPSYLERGDSSLVSMVDYFIKQSDHKYSGFFLDDFGRLHEIMSENSSLGIPSILFGVSYALLDYIDRYPSELYNDLIVIETGGMKGKRQEMTKSMLHKEIINGFGVNDVHSEYGMTELLSQSYSTGKGLFTQGFSMKVLVRDVTDPYTSMDFGRTGVINVIDLSNIDSCAFIETQDLGRLYMDGTFEVVGRLDQADIRGCNLMVSDV